MKELRYALRQLRKSPGYSVTVLAMLALGIGANTAVFSVVDAAMLRPLPYAQPQRLVEVDAYDEGTAQPSNASYPDFFDWRARKAQRKGKAAPAELAEIKAKLRALIG